MAKVLVIAGGGGGGGNGGAGGGAGGYIYNSNYLLTPQTYTVTVGGGGAAGAVANGTRYNGANGSNSVFGTLTALGGGGGCAGGSGGTTSDGVAGGSGGGASDYGARVPGTGVASGGAGTSGQGYKGGNASTTGIYFVSGGGGGAGGAAPDITNNSANQGGVGGAGVSNSITGSAVVRASGGSGYLQATATEGGGGASGSAGTANTGGGGGSTGAGGSGVVIVSYVTADYGLITITGSSNTQTVVGTETVCVFNESGDLVVHGISKIMGVTNASIKKVGGKNFNEIEIDGSPLDDVSLTAYYKFEGNSNATNGGVNGTDTNVSYGTNYGLIGQGAAFNGSTSIIALNNTIMNITTEDFTISFAFRTSYSGTDYMEYFGKGGAGSNGWAVWMRSGTIRLGMDDNTNRSWILVGGGSYGDGNWHRVVIAVDRNVGAYLYVDGKYKGLTEDTIPDVGNITTTEITNIGAHLGGEWSFTGHLDEFAFWKGKVLSSAEALSLFKNVKKIGGVSNV